MTFIPTEIRMAPVQVEEPLENDGEEQQDKTLSGPIIGIIYPPPEVRNIVDKTASFVARNGPEFEARIRQNEIGNPKFNFLSAGDPYHAYYQHKVGEFREGKGNDPAAILPANIQRLSLAHQRQQELLKQVAEQQFIPKEQPAEFEFIADPPSISALDLDIVKVTAQFVARNGRQFLTNLMSHEQRNYQFDFLRPQHSLFQYFTKLVEQYTKILIPPKDLMGKLKLDSDKSNMMAVLEDAKYRANYLKFQDAQRRREEDKVERERVAYAQIDWHDFVVVEVVDYQPFETGSFPPPTTPEEVGARVLMEERYHEDDGDIEMQIESDGDEADTVMSRALGGLSRMEDRTKMHGVSMHKDNNQVQDMDEASSDEERDGSGLMRAQQQQQKVAPPTPMLPPTHDKVIVKKYDPKQAHKSGPATKAGSAGQDDFLISPITGEKIAASKVAEHMRIGLLDPRWVEQRDKHTVEKLNQDNVFAAGTAIEASLKQLAERRTDIFGIGDEETVIGKKLGEEETRKDERVTWDGHTSSVEAATRAARANITLEDQIHQIHKVKGLLPDEEKEKIGPKPGPQSGGHHHQQHHHQMQQQHHHHQQQQHHHQQQQHHHHHQQQQQQRMMASSASLQAVQNQAQIVVPPKPPQMQAPPPQHQPVMMMPMRPPPMIPPPFPVGFLPQMPPQGPPSFVPTGPPPPELSQMMEEEPPNKKSRTEDHLVPEADFLAMSGGPVTLHIQVPSLSDKPEWRLNGQLIPITMAATDLVSSLKSKIQEETDMPPAKQKVSYEGMFFKDNNSMAYYNLRSGAVIQLAPKERGGRKK